MSSIHMEQHPVPQNVTTFQFRLIGDMTLKQFGYLAGGAIFAYICYKLPLPLFLNWPLAIVFALGGFGFAFVPIEERPMDVWVLSFFKSVYSPTQYIWSKSVPREVPVTTPATAQQTQTNKGQVINAIFQPKADQPLAGTILTTNKTQGPFDWLFAMFQNKPKPSLNTPAPVPAKMDFTPPPTVQARVAPDPTPQPKTDRPLAEDSDVHKQLADLQAEHNRVAAELAKLRAQSVPPPKPTGTYVATPAAKTGPSVRIITADRAVKAGLPRLTTFANVVTGIVKDGDQNLLPGVLVTVKDKDGVPLRALKTNRLGQFAASTPLINGMYFLEIEDPRLRYTFDRAQITLNGSVVPALEIFAKSQKEITRAKLEKELFGDKPNG